MNIEEYLINTSVVRGSKTDNAFMIVYADNIRDYLSYCSEEELKELDEWAEKLYKEMKEEDYKWYERKRYDGKNRKGYISLEELYETLGEDFVDNKSYFTELDNEADCLEESDLYELVDSLNLGPTATCKLLHGGAGTDFESRKQRARAKNTEKRGFVINGKKWYVFR